MKLFLSLLLSAQAHAGFWQRFCDKIIADDPYQYESAPDDWINRRLAQLRIKQQWGRLTKDDETHLRFLEHERTTRDRMDHEDTLQVR